MENKVERKRFMNINCYHFTKNRFLKSILEQGLKPNFGTNCFIARDKKGAKVSYSVGEFYARQMFMALHIKYCQIFQNNIMVELYDESGRKYIDEIQNSESFEEWAEPGVYLMFDWDCIERSEDEEDWGHDAYTYSTIPPEQLKVCVIRNTKTGEIISSKYDVACFWMARIDITYKEIRESYQAYKERIKEFEAEEFEMEYIELSKFCEMYPEILEEKMGEAPRKIAVDEVRTVAEGESLTSIENAIRASSGPTIDSQKELIQ